MTEAMPEARRTTAIRSRGTVTLYGSYSKSVKGVHALDALECTDEDFLGNSR
jgi:hypothetical protein